MSPETRKDWRHAQRPHRLVWCAACKKHHSTVYVCHRAEYALQEINDGQA
jgi:hypothetical protein